MKETIRKLFRRAGYEIINVHRPMASTSLPHDFTAEECALYARVRPYTVTTAERVVTLARAVKHLLAANVPGAFVECGVWKGGSAMAMALTLQQQRSDRELFLYDVFAEVPAPVAQDGQWAAAEWQRYRDGTSQIWEPIPSVETVTKTLVDNGCDLTHVRFIKGKVEDTIPAQAPDSIALLRIDTDFYESTRHELLHLYPRLSPGGILIIDDYGAFQGSRQAVDEYVAEHKLTAFMNRIDADARLIVKP